MPRFADDDQQIRRSYDSQSEDSEEAEREAIEDNDIVAFTADDVRELGPEEVWRRTLARLDPAGRRNIHLSLDIDALDPAWAPSTGCPVEGGMSLAEGLTLVQKVG